MTTGANHLTLAVAGSRKTQGIVDACVEADSSERILILTYTTSNQLELQRRLASQAGDRPNVEVCGWFAFLIGNFVRPFLPYAFRGRRVMGFDFKSDPQQYAATTSWSRYFNEASQVRKVHLPQLAVRLEEASGGAGIRRLERLHDRVFVDEVQDLCGYDLEMLELLMTSSLRIEMVGDVRQAILATNEREAKNKKFMFMGIWDWFRAQEKAGRLHISQRRETWRCRPEVAALADSLFGAEWGFDTTVSSNSRATFHDGIYLVRATDVDDYVETFLPLILRYSSSSAKPFAHLSLMNFGQSKGLSREHVIIFPTGPIKSFLQSGTALQDQQAAKFYVAITRAEQSVAIVMDAPGNCTFRYWSP